MDMKIAVSEIKKRLLKVELSLDENKGIGSKEILRELKEAIQLLGNLEMNLNHLRVVEKLNFSDEEHSKYMDLMEKLMDSYTKTEVDYYSEQIHLLIDEVLKRK